MDSEAPRKLSSRVVIEALQNEHTICHPLVPEKWKFSNDNIEGVIKHPICITCGQISELLVLDASMSAFFAVRLHSPADVKKLYTYVKDAKGSILTLRVFCMFFVKKVCITLIMSAV